MDVEATPREALLELVRTMAQRVRLDEELGKPLSWLTPEEPPKAAPDPLPGPPAAIPCDGRSGLETLLSEIGECRRCPLGEMRHRVVFGEGNPHAELLFVGEAPGADEDAQGRPFVGPAGQLLTRIIAAMGLKREEVYICNILKCRPPGNRNPQPEEIAACEPFLIRQIEAIRPKVICALGSFAARTLLKTEAPISVLRGRFHAFRGVPLMPTYHPAYLLRNPGAKKQAWDDVRSIMNLLREGCEVM